MAAALGISPSYLNLIERNQRPLTVQLLLKLSEVYAVDLAGLKASGEAQATLTELKAVFAEPLLAGELPGDGELVEIADAAPNAAAGILKLHRAYREMEERLSALLAASGQAPAETGRLPIDEVREAFEERPHHFGPIDHAAETIARTLTFGDDPAAAIRLYLRERHDIAVRVLPADAMPLWRRRFDRHSRRLFLNERLPPAARLLEMAGEAMAQGAFEAIDSEARAFGFSTDEALRLARVELLAYGARALAMPYAPFQALARRLSYDVELLALRSQVGFADAAFRLASLRRAGAPAPPFFVMEVDQAGNLVRRAGAQGFPAKRFGGACVKLPVFEAFAEPGRVIVEAAEGPDGTAWLLVARTEEPLGAAFGERVRRSAILVGLDLSQAGETVYHARLPQGGGRLAIGPACRLCERADCAARAAPPLTRPLAPDLHTGALSPFDFR